MPREHLSCAEIAAALGRGREVKLGPDAYNTLCPCHNDAGPSLSIKEKGGKLLFYCHAGCKQSEVLSELTRLGLLPKKGKVWVAKPFAPEGKVPPSDKAHYRLGKSHAHWTYRDYQGRIAGVIHRFNVTKPNGQLGKEIVPLTWCYSDEGDLSWEWRQMCEPRCLYNEHRLGEDKPILIVEGEKTCEKAQLLVGDKYLCLTWPGGAKALRKANWTLLKGRDVTIWPDHDAPGFKAARELAELLIVIGVKSLRRVEFPEHVKFEKEGWDLADELPQDLDPLKLLKNAPTYEPQGDEVIERFNAKFALVLIGGQATILHEYSQDATGRVELRYLSLSGFKEYYGNKVVLVGKQSIPESTYWLKHEARRSYHHIVFEPELEVKGAYNMWRGFSVEPDPTGDWSLLDEHINQNLACGDESLYQWILAWFAHITQHPDKKVGTSLVFRGKQGVGKTIIGKAMGELYRPHYVLVDDPRYVLGQFNAHMATALLLHCDEGFFAGDPRNVGKLKGMVTSDTHRIELKGKDSFEVSNHMRMLITTNQEFAVPAAFEERRFAVLHTGDGRLQDRAFFNAMWRQLSSGGFGGLLYHLQHLDLTTVDPAVIPTTSALQDQKLHSLTGVERFWFERLFYGQILLKVNGVGAWPEFVLIEELYQAYVRRSEDWGERRRVDSPIFGKELRKFWPNNTIEKRRVTVSRLDDEGNRTRSQAWAYMLAPLADHRAIFSQLLGKMQWEEVEGYIGGELTIPGQNGEDVIPF
jgi:Family of unknown function (DUF5906)/Domain of unknown function (DUF6371)